MSFFFLFCCWSLSKYIDEQSRYGSFSLPFFFVVVRWSSVLFLSTDPYSEGWFIWFVFHFTFPPWHHFTVGAVKLPEDAHNLPLTPFHPNHVQIKFLKKKKKVKKKKFATPSDKLCVFKWMDATTAINFFKKKTAQKVADGLVGWTGGINSRVPQFCHWQTIQSCEPVHLNVLRWRGIKDKTKWRLVAWNFKKKTLRKGFLISLPACYLKSRSQNFCCASSLHCTDILFSDFVTTYVVVFRFCSKAMCFHFF